MANNKPSERKTYLPVAYPVHTEANRPGTEDNLQPKVNVNESEIPNAYKFLHQHLHFPNNSETNSDSTPVSVHDPKQTVIQALVRFYKYDSVNAVSPETLQACVEAPYHYPPEIGDVPSSAYDFGIYRILDAHFYTHTVPEIPLLVDMIRDYRNCPDTYSRQMRWYLSELAVILCKYTPTYEFNPSMVNLYLTLKTKNIGWKGFVVEKTLMTFSRLHQSFKQHIFTILFYSCFSVVSTFLTLTSLWTLPITLTGWCYYQIKFSGFFFERCLSAAQRHYLRKIPDWVWLILVVGIGAMVYHFLKKRRQNQAKIPTRPQATLYLAMMGLSALTAWASQCEGPMTLFNHFLTMFKMGGYVRAWMGTECSKTSCISYTPEAKKICLGCASDRAKTLVSPMTFTLNDIRTRPDKYRAELPGMLTESDEISIPMKLSALPLPVKKALSQVLLLEEDAWEHTSSHPTLELQSRLGDMVLVSIASVTRTSSPSDSPRSYNASVASGYGTYARLQPVVTKQPAVAAHTVYQPSVFDNGDVTVRAFDGPKPPQPRVWSDKDESHPANPAPELTEYDLIKNKQFSDVSSSSAPTRQTMDIPPTTQNSQASDYNPYSVLSQDEINMPACVVYSKKIATDYYDTFIAWCGIHKNTIWFSVILSVLAIATYLVMVLTLSDNTDESDIAHCHYLKTPGGCPYKPGFCHMAHPLETNDEGRGVLGAKRGDNQRKQPKHQDDEEQQTSFASRGRKIDEKVRFISYDFSEVNIAKLFKTGIYISMQKFNRDTGSSEVKTAVNVADYDELKKQGYVPIVTRQDYARRFRELRDVINFSVDVTDQDTFRIVESAYNFGVLSHQHITHLREALSKHEFTSDSSDMVEELLTNFKPRVSPATGKVIDYTDHLFRPVFDIYGKPKLRARVASESVETTIEDDYDRAKTVLNAKVSSEIPPVLTALLPRNARPLPRGVRNLLQPHTTVPTTTAVNETVLGLEPSSCPVDPRLIIDFYDQRNGQSIGCGLWLPNGAVTMAHLLVAEHNNGHDRSFKLLPSLVGARNCTGELMLNDFDFNSGIDLCKISITTPYPEGVTKIKINTAVVGHRVTAWTFKNGKLYHSSSPVLETSLPDGARGTNATQRVFSVQYDSVGGYSGSPVFDQFGYLVGFHRAGGNKCNYVLSIDNRLAACLVGNSSLAKMVAGTDF